MLDFCHVFCYSLCIEVNLKKYTFTNSQKLCRFTGIHTEIMKCVLTCSFRALIIDEEFLTKIIEIFKKQGIDENQIKYTCFLKDYNETHYNTLTDLFGSDNALERSIGGLIITIPSAKDSWNNIIIKIGKCGLLNIFTISVDLGSKRYPEKLIKEINFLIRTVSRSYLYSFVSRVLPFLLIFFTPYLVYTTFGLPETYTIPIFGIIDKPFGTSIISRFAQISSELFLSEANAVLLISILRKVFPPLVFKIGYGKSREANRASILENIIWGIFIALIINILASIIFNTLDFTSISFENIREILKKIMT